MLVIWRRAGEKFTLGDDIEVEVLESRPGKVKLGVKAPGSVAIVRGENRATRSENIKAAANVDLAAIAELLYQLPHQ